MLIQNTSDSYLKLLHSCHQRPEYLRTKTYQQISLNFAMFGISVDNHKQLFFFVARDFCGGWHLRPFKFPASWASREWSWDISDNKGGFLQCLIPFHDVNSENKLTFLTNTFVRSSFCCHLAFLIIAFLVVCAEKRKEKWLLKYCIVVNSYPMQHVHSLWMLMLVHCLCSCNYNSYLVPDQ